jgi:hypothetical protein
MRPVNHVFICEGWQVYNDMFPFFRAIQKSHGAMFFTDVTHGTFSSHIRPLEELRTFVPKTDRTVVYLALSRHYREYVRKSALGDGRVNTVMLFHGIAGPWAGIARKHRAFVDVFVAASDIDGTIVRDRNSYRVETIGWPKGETFLTAHPHTEIDSGSIVISSNWSHRCDGFKICDHAQELACKDVTFMMHPVLLSGACRKKSQVEPRYVKRQVRKMHGRAHIVTCEYGVLPHMHGKECMLSAISSSAFEWLLFDRPIFFLRPHEALTFGRNISFDKSLISQIDAEEPERLTEARHKLRKKLMSHFDGKWAERFAALADEMENALLH